MQQAIEKTAEELRQKIVAFENVIKQMPQVEVEIRHHFAPGIYLREMKMKKDTVLTGKIHKTEHKCILAEGVVVVVSETGRKLLRAPAVIHSMPGTKRALHSLTDITWINVHHNPENIQDEKKIEEYFVVDTFDQYLSFTEQKQIEGDK